jgi:hypothetical protein
MDVDLSPDDDTPHTYRGRRGHAPTRKFCINVRVTQRHRLAAEQLAADLDLPLASVIEQGIAALAARRCAAQQPTT